MSLIGFVFDGEVEDYLILLMGFDFGDFNDMVVGINGDLNSLLIFVDYQMIFVDDGVCYKILINIVGVFVFKIGVEFDDEVNGQFNVMVVGDDNSMLLGVVDLDDEDGFDLNNFLLFILI